VVRAELQASRSLLLGLGAALVLTIASYGLTHPVWVESASTTMPAGKHPTAMLILHNQGRVPVEVELVAANGRHDARVGWPWSNGRHLPVSIGPGHSETFTLNAGAGSCGGLEGTIRFRVFGTIRSEPLSVVPSGFPSCS
jgi:hypothetical protein